MDFSKILIGTSGYDYPEWKGVFYPQELKRKDFLSYYATCFNALELNYSFYSMPKKQQMQDFYERSEGKLQFSIKANRELTHEIGSSWRERANEFKDAVSFLNDKNVLSTVLFQLPQGFHYEKENRLYLADLIKEFAGYNLVVEFRHKEWIRDSVFEGLLERGVSVAFCDMPDIKYIPHEDIKKLESDEKLFSQFMGNTTYIRLHGRNKNAWYVNESNNSSNGSARYDYAYSKDELGEFVPVIKNAVRKGKKVLVFFNNHPKGSGALNAAELKNMIGGSC